MSKPGRETGKQHGLASPRRPFLDLRWGGLQCQTSRPEPIKKEGFAAEGFNLHLAVASVSNVASRTKKKAGFAAEGFNLHLAVAKPGLSTKKASQKPGRETGKQHGLASPRRPFLDLRWGGLQCQTSRPEPIKKEGFAAEGFNLHLAVASVSNVASRTKKKAGFAAEGFNLHLAVAKPGLSTEKASQKPGRETGKQHGLASPRRPFLDLRWGGLQCQTSRPEPIKKEGFAAEGFNLHLAMAKPGLSTEKASQKPGRETGKQHGLASPRRPFLDLRWGGLQCQTSRPEPIKKEGFAAEGFNLHLAVASVSNVASRTQKKAGFAAEGFNSTSQWQNQDSAPKKLPRSRAAKQGNSMAWRAQGDRFWTCVGVVFSVKRRVQNL